MTRWIKERQKILAEYVGNRRRNIQIHRCNLRIAGYVEQGLEDVGDYIIFELKNSKSAIQMIQDLRKKMTSLVMPLERYELDEDDASALLGVRKCCYKDYKTHYVLQKQTDAIIILRILHMFVGSRVKLYRLFGIQTE